jgi:hypothetical protein
MPAPDPSFGWQDAAVAFVVIASCAFFVTWIVTDVLHIGRTPYIAILSAIVGALTVGYLGWSKTSLKELATSNWPWGIVAGVAVAALATPLIRKLPTQPHPGGIRLVGTLAWEGVVYGTAEALLLATLPVIAIWQGSAAAGWTAGAWAEAAVGALAVGGALLTILVHHLGYEEFRAHEARPKMLGALVTCGLQALAFLITGSVLAPVVAHIALHGQLVFRGVEMPPARTWRFDAFGGVLSSQLSANGHKYAARTRT